MNQLRKDQIKINAEYERQIIKLQNTEIFLRDAAVSELKRHDSEINYHINQINLIRDNNDTKS